MANTFIGNYYSKKAATAGYSGVSAEYDICPKNWRMPRADSTDRYAGYRTSEYFNLLDAYDATGWTEHSFDGMKHNSQFGDVLYYNTPFYFAQSGVISGTGSFNHIGFAFRWQANNATKNEALAMSVGYGNENILPFITNQSWLRNVRCIAR